LGALGLQSWVLLVGGWEEGAGVWGGGFIMTPQGSLTTKTYMKDIEEYSRYSMA